MDLFHVKQQLTRNSWTWLCRALFLNLSLLGHLQWPPKLDSWTNSYVYIRLMFFLFFSPSLNNKKTSSKKRKGERETSRALFISSLTDARLFCCDHRDRVIYICARIRSFFPRETITFPTFLNNLFPANVNRNNWIWPRWPVNYIFKWRKKSADYTNLNNWIEINFWKSLKRMDVITVDDDLPYIFSS